MDRWWAMSPSEPPRTALPVGIPQFSSVNSKVSSGLRPSLDDGLDWLREIRNDPTLRQGRRRNGKITVINDKLIPGPFTLDARRLILERLLQTQQTYGDSLITEHEIDTIQRIWVNDLLAINTPGDDA